MKIITCIFLAMFIGVFDVMAQDIKPVGKSVGVDNQGNTIYQVHANGIEIGYKLIGTGEPLIMIVSLGSTMERWPSLMVEPLSKKYQLILVDNRGVGYTSYDNRAFTCKLFAEDVIGLLDALRVKKTNVLGYSMGSMITQELLLEYPERFNKAIICATFIDGSPIAKAIRNQVLSDKKPEALPVIKGQLKMIADWKTPLDKLSFISNQVMLVAGTSDAVAGVDSSKIIASSIPGAWLIQFKNASHLLPKEAPTELAKAVLAFLDINKPVGVMIHHE